MGTKKIVFALSLASAVALGVGLLTTTEVRAGELEQERENELPAGADEVVEAIRAVDASAIAQARAFEGEWTYIGGQKQRDGIEDAIAASMAAISPLVRKLGTKRLRESNPVPSRITLRVEGESLTVSFDGDSTKAKLDGTPVKSVSPQGDKSKISHSVRGSKLIQFIDGDGGDRHNKFKLNEAGDRLYLDVKITSSHLPVPCAYRLSFKRK